MIPKTAVVVRRKRGWKAFAIFSADGYPDIYCMAWTRKGCGEFGVLNKGESIRSVWIKEIFPRKKNPTRRPK